MRPRPRLPIALALLLSATAATAQDNPVKSALEREIIGPRTTLEEVQEFVEARIPRMPEVRTAEDWTDRADRYRVEALDRVIFRGEAGRWRDASTKVDWLETIEGGPGYRIRKLRYEAIPGLWIPALLYEPTEIHGKVPVVLNVNGHDAQGKAAAYKQIRCINQAKRGMIALNVEWLGMGQLRGDGFQHGLINAVDLCGTSGIALHYLYLKRGLDVLLAHEHADPERVAVTGLSGGGWQTIFFSPLETRVTLCDPVAGYSSFRTRVHHFSDLGDSEQTPCDLATVLDYTHLTAMMAPRPTLLTFNESDNCCFAAPHALPPLLEAASPIFALFGKPENLRHHTNFDPGTHNYERDNREALYRILGDSFFPGNPGYPDEEIASDDEVKSPEALTVELPEDNLSILRVARNLAAELPRPSSDDKAERRKRLRAIVRPLEENARGERVQITSDEQLNVTTWKLHVGPSWTVPAVEMTRGEGEPKSVAILLADEGRASAADRAEALLDDGQKVVAIDPFYFGESRVAEKAYLFALLVGTVGERPLGIQAGEVLATARWQKARGEGKPVRIVAQGPRTGLVALVAAALDPETIAEVELHEGPTSLKDVIDRGLEFADRPEVFCFGLLESFDVPQIEELGRK
jgi:hypothetical protein